MRLWPVPNRWTRPPSPIALAQMAAASSRAAPWVASSFSSRAIAARVQPTEAPPPPTCLDMVQTISWSHGAVNEHPQDRTDPLPGHRAVPPGPGRAGRAGGPAAQRGRAVRAVLGEPHDRAPGPPGADQRRAGRAPPGTGDLRRPPAGPPAAGGVPVLHRGDEPAGAAGEQPAAVGRPGR